MYNKRQLKKINDKKILRKIGKSWKIISLSLFMAIGGTEIVTHINANAANLNTTNANNHTETNMNKNQMNANHSKLVKPQSVSVSYNANQQASSSVNRSNISHSTSSTSASNVNSYNISFKANSIANHVVGNAFSNNTLSAYSLASSYADDLFDINYDYITIGLDSALPEDENILGSTVNAGWYLESGTSSLSINKLNSINNTYSNAVSKVTNDVTNMNPSWKSNKVDSYYNTAESANSNIKMAYKDLNPHIYMNIPTDGGIMNITRDMLNTAYLRSCTNNDLHASPITINDMANASTFADEASNTAASADSIINSDKASYSASVADRSESNSANTSALASAYSRNYNSMYSAYAYINNDFKITSSYLHKFGISAVTIFQSEIAPQFNNYMKDLNNYCNVSQMNSYATSVDAEYTHDASEVVSYANNLAYKHNSLAYSASYSASYSALYSASYSASVSTSYSTSYANSVNASYAASYSASVNYTDNGLMPYNPIDTDNASKKDDTRNTR